MSDNPYQSPDFDPKLAAGYPAASLGSVLTVKRIGVLSAGKLMGCMYLVLGLIIGGFMSLFSVLGVVAGNADSAPAALAVGAGAIVLIPIFYGGIGLVGGMLGALLYNALASVVGGIELELKPTAVAR